MEIIELDNFFDFSQLELTHPVSIQGGAYFTKIEYKKKPLYIQTTKSLTKQGFVKNGKKIYCDLMFDKHSEKVIQWFENLEEKCKKMIFDKKDEWFEHSLEEGDIDTAFNSTIRIYKSGKYYLLRTNIKNDQNNLPAVKIYNERQIPLTINDFNTDTNIISILGIQGIKFTSRFFQIEIEVKQIMVLDNEPLFDNCLIKTHKPETTNKNNDSNDTKNSIVNEIDDKNKVYNTNYLGKNIEDNKIDIELDNTTKQYVDMQSNVDNDILEDIQELETKDIQELETKDIQELETEDIQELETEDIQELDIEDLDIINPDELKEINDTEYLEDNSETMKLKKPNQIYFELFKQAREKAKLAKKNAIIAYLEAKNIKKTYMIENIESDSDIDDEIDKVSENELDNFY